MARKNNNNFSTQLEKWINSKTAKTLGDLDEVFAEKSFAIAILILMSIPALPIPTGGITHVLEVITLILAGQILIGRKTIWIPKRWKNKAVNGKIQRKGLSGLLKFIRFFERFSKPRWAHLVIGRLGQVVFSITVIVFTLFAMFAPPFSGLDTLPALGVVILCLSIILEDVALSIAGLLVGSGGIVLIFTIGKVLFDAIKHFFFN